MTHFPHFVPFFLVNLVLNGPSASCQSIVCGSKASEDCDGPWGNYTLHKLCVVMNNRAIAYEFSVRESLIHMVSLNGGK